MVLVLSNRADASALRVAATHGVPTDVLEDPADPAGWLTDLERYRVDLIVLAGYLKLVPGPVIARYRDRIINIHPALLPAHGGKGMYGRRVHEAVLAGGDRESGATVHLVDEVYDRGAILAQHARGGASRRFAGATRPRGCSRWSTACFPRWSSPPPPRAARCRFPNLWSSLHDS